MNREHRVPSCAIENNARSSTRRRLRMLLTAGAVAAATLAGPTAVGAADAAAPTPAPVAHPESDHMGSTVAAHEGPGLGSQPLAGTDPLVAATTSVRGMDVSGWQGNVNWPSAWAGGGRFAYIKATESTGYTNPYFAQQYNGSYAVGMIRGAYHFALPDRSPGATQADYFVNHGGGWSPDGKTLPPLLDIEYNPYGSTCYGLSPSAMVSWIHAFSNRVKARTGRYPAIYTTTNWWTQCTGNNGGFANSSPLFIARYASSPGILPAGWLRYTFWQYADHGILPGDQDLFPGTLTQLQTLARG